MGGAFAAGAVLGEPAAGPAGEPANLRFPSGNVML